MKILSALLLTILPLVARGELRTDIEFAKAGDVSLTLDAFVPEGAGPFPTCILVHGGGFTKGDKTSFIKPLFEPLSKAGFAWFTINYRLAPAHRWPACLDDVETAIRWVRTHAKEYKVDPARIALIGESAGGHLVALLATDEQFLKAEKLKNQDLRGVIAAGPTTSARMNELSGFLIEKGVRGLIGKGGMGATVKEQLHGRGVYFAFTGGCAALASSHMTLKGVFYEDLGMAEAVWAIELDRLPLVVGIDAWRGDIFAAAARHAKETFSEYSRPDTRGDTCGNK